MNWIFDNLQIVIVVGSTIAWWLTQRKQGDEEDAPKLGERPGREKIDVEQMERNRRLREEIQRKREARQRGSAEPAPSAHGRDSAEPRRRPEIEIPEDVTEQIPPVLRELMGIPEPQPRAPAPPPVPKINPVTQRQQRIEHEMAELEAKRREADAVAAKARKGAPIVRQRSVSSANSLSDRDFLATLRDPRQARRAIVMREILSKPIALRR